MLSLALSPSNWRSGERSGGLPTAAACWGSPWKLGGEPKDSCSTRRWKPVVAPQEPSLMEPEAWPAADSGKGPSAPGGTPLPPPHVSSHTAPTALSPAPPPTGAAPWPKALLPSAPHAEPAAAAVLRPPSASAAATLSSPDVQNIPCSRWMPTAMPAPVVLRATLDTAPLERVVPAEARRCGAARPPMLAAVKEA